MKTRKAIVKEAAKDAAEYMQAQMDYGEGSGVRRRHVSRVVDFKSSRVPGYREAFERSAEVYDPLMFITKAHRARRRKDVSNYVGKNARAIARGDHRNLSPSLVITVATVAALHHTGYDRVLWEKSKDQGRKILVKFHQLSDGLEAKYF